MTLKELVAYFLRLGTLGFGGPIALVGYMQRDLVERRGWFTAEQYRDGLALAQLAPGPLAAQLAVYLGWARARALGATLVALAFVAPSFLMVLALSALYVRYGGMAWIAGAFYGIGAAVIAIIARSALRLARTAVGRDWILWSIFGANAAVTALTAREILWVFFASGVLAVLPALAGTRGVDASGEAVRGCAGATVLPWLSAALAAGAAAPLLVQILWFFAKSSLVVFGSGLAIVPFLYGGVVQDFRWLNDRQFLDAIAVSMITPGPVVITVAFIGYLVAGPLGSVAAAIGMFLPVYLVVLIAAPWYDRIRRHAQIGAFVAGVTAAAAGAMAGAAFVLGGRALVDATTVGIAVVAFVLLDKRLRIPEPALIMAAGVLGIRLS